MLFLSFNWRKAQFFWLVFANNCDLNRNQTRIESNYFSSVRSRNSSPVLPLLTQSKGFDINCKTCVTHFKTCANNELFCLPMNSLYSSQRIGDLFERLNCLNVHKTHYFSQNFSSIKYFRYKEGVSIKFDCVSLHVRHNQQIIVVKLDSLLAIDSNRTIVRQLYWLW